MSGSKIIGMNLFGVSSIGLNLSVMFFTLEKSYYDSAPAIHVGNKLWLLKLDIDYFESRVI